MSEEEGKKKFNKNLFFAIGGLVVAVAVVVVLVIVISGNLGGLDESWFVGDDKKMVLTIESNPDMASEDESIPINSHTVYEYSGEKITSLKIYYQYPDTDRAKKAYDTISANNKGQYKDVELNGRYVVLVAVDSDYENLTTSDVKQQIDWVNTYKNKE